MKLLKVYISVFCMCSLSVLLNSCDDFLKEEPLDMKSSDQFWKTKADAESGVNALYFGGVPYLHNTDVGGGWTPKATKMMMPITQQLTKRVVMKQQRKR